MIFGLPVITFFLLFILPFICIILSIVYALTYKDDDCWWLLDQLDKSKDADKDKGD